MDPVFSLFSFRPLFPVRQLKSALIRAELRQPIRTASKYIAANPLVTTGFHSLLSTGCPSGVKSLFMQLCSRQSITAERKTNENVTLSQSVLVSASKSVADSWIKCFTSID